MSADNWAMCPKCTAQAAARVTAKFAEVATGYGHLPLEEFDALREQAAALAMAPAVPTLREDYEFYGAEEGVVRWQYSAACKECGLSEEFKGEHEIYSAAAGVL